MTEENLRNPFVIACKDCKKILSDSFSLSDYKNDHLIHSFSTVKEKARIFVGSGIFQNCLIQKVECDCGKEVGVFLSSAGGDFNGNAGCYAFEKDSVFSYQLGSVIVKERGLSEVIEDVEKLKSVVAKMYKRIFQ